MHIAILDADVPVPAVYSQRGLYSSQFRQLLERAAARLNQSQPDQTPIEVHTTTFDVVGGCLPPLASLRTSSSNSEPISNPLALPIDGILVTGAAAGAYEAATHPWIAPLQSFLQTVYTSYPDVKLFGSCFGHQIIAQALLSPAYPADRAFFKVEAAAPRGNEMGLVPITLTPEFVERFSVLRESSAQMRLQMVHGDWVTGVEENPAMEFPPGWVNVGASERCPIQGLYCSRRVLTYQGHFEFDVWVTTETVVEFARRKGWEEQAVEEYVRDIQKGRIGCKEGQDDHDESKLAAEVVVLFFAGRD